MMVVSMLTATGGLGLINYTILPANITNATGTFTNLAPATYTINAVDANGCSVSTMVVVTEPTQLVWTSVAQTNVSCNGGNDGSITALASGGTGTINYNLQPGNVTNQTGLFPNLIAGVYTLTTTNANGCSISTLVTVSEQL